MSIMELDPPDYWLVDCPDGDPPARPVTGVWLVTPMTRERGHQVLLVRVNPPHRVGFMDHDFVVLEPSNYNLSLSPTRAGATRVNIHLYRGQYRGQTTVQDSELDLHDLGAVISREDWATQAQAHLVRHRRLPSWAFEDRLPDGEEEQRERRSRRQP